MSETLQQSDPFEPEPSLPPRHDMHWVFTGPSGLRAGWSILVFLLILGGTDLLVGWLLHVYMHQLAAAAGIKRGESAPMPPAFGFLQEVVQASGMFTATIAMAFIEHRPVLFYGFEGRARITRFVSGLALGFIAISAFVLALWKAGFLSIDGQLLHGAVAWRYALGWGAVFLLVAIFEESLFRGYLQYTLTRGLGFWWGALLISLLFGFGHGSNPGESPVGLFSAAAIGLVLCLSLWYTGSLWWAVGFHAAWDWGESYFYGTSDSGMLAKGHLFGEHPLGKLLWSGGATGPEGSLLIVPLILIFLLLMWLWWHRRAEKPFGDAAWKPAKLTLQNLP